MELVGLVITVIGAIVNLIGACLLLWGFDESNPRYVDDGMLYPGQQTSRVVPNLLHDQRRVAVLTVVGSTLLLAGAVLVVVAAM